MNEIEFRNQAVDYLLYSNNKSSEKYVKKTIKTTEEYIDKIKNTGDVNTIKEFIKFCIRKNINISYPKHYNNYKKIESDVILNNNLFFLRDVENLKIIQNLETNIKDINNIKEGGSLGVKLISRQKGPMFKNNAEKIIDYVKNDNYIKLYEDINIDNQELKKILLSCKGKNELLKHFKVITKLDLKNIDYSSNFILIASDESNKKFFNSMSDYPDLEKGLDIIIYIGNRKVLKLNNGGHITIGGEAKEINQGGGSQKHQLNNMLSISKMNGNSTKGIGIYSGSAIYANDAFGNLINDEIKNENIFHVGDVFLNFDDTIKKIINRK